MNAEKAPDNELARIGWGCALAVLSAVLLTLSFAPYDAWFLVWVGFVPMAVAQHRVLPRRLSGIAPAIGVGGFVAGSFGGVFFPQSAAWYVKILPLLVAGGVFAFSRAERARFERRGYATWPLEGAMSWVAIELFRMPALGTWGYLGLALYRQTWFLQPVATLGLFGLDALIVVTNFALAMLVIALLDRRGVRGAARAISLPLALRWCGGAAVAVTLWAVSSLATKAHYGATVRVAVLQPGFRPQGPRSNPELHDRRILDTLSEQTRRASREGARVIVWPEGTLSQDPQWAYMSELGPLAREASAYLFVGYRIDGPSGTRNEVLTVGPDGTALGTYGKNHPVGFLHETSISRGTYPTYETPFGTIGAIICYDMDFTDTPRELARRGAQLIAVPSADWAAIAKQHYVHAVFRALETGAAIAKSEYSRDSAIVDGSGAILASAVTPEGRAAVLVADVALHSDVPLSAKWGDWVGWICLAGTVARGLGRLRGRRKTRGTDAAPGGLSAGLQ